VQYGVGHDDVDRLGQLQRQHVLAPHLSPVPQSHPRQLNHVWRGVERQHAPARHQRQRQRLFGYPAGAATDVQHRRIRRESSQAPQDAAAHVCRGWLDTS